MAIRYSIEKHAVAAPAKLLATNGGAHIYNVTLSTDADNGAIIKRGAWNSFDNYKEAKATTFDGVVREKAANGNWYVEVLSNQGLDALFVHNVPINAETYNNEFKKESNFFNEAGSVVRAHELCAGDIIEVSAENFSETGEEPYVGGTITSIADKKLVVGTTSI